MTNFDPELASRVELIQRVDDLEAQLAVMKSTAEEASLRLRSAFGLRPAIAKMLAFMADGRPKAKQAMYDHLFYDRVAEDDEPDPKIIDIYVCLLRKRLALAGISIETLWAHGYRLADGAEIVRAVMEGQPHAPLPPLPLPAKSPRPRRPNGVRRDLALTELRKRMDPDGLVRVTSAAMSRATEATGGAAVIVQLEECGHIDIVSRPQTHGGPWVLRLANA